jgi:hypothetical protein
MLASAVQAVYPHCRVVQVYIQQNASGIAGGQYCNAAWQASSQAQSCALPCLVGTTKRLKQEQTHLL